MIRSPFVSLLFVSAVLLGSWLMARTWNGVVYIQIRESSRDPAAVQNLEQTFAVDHSLLHETPESRVLEQATLITREQEIGIQLGHFLAQGDHGLRQFACQVQNHPGLYDRVELGFVAVGVAENGRTPKMTVDAPCVSEGDLGSLSPIWLPMSEIYQSEPKEQELHLPTLSGTDIRFADLTSAWPERWTLMQVRFYNRVAGLPELRVVPNRPTQHLSFDWSQNH